MSTDSPPDGFERLQVQPVAWRWLVIAAAAQFLLHAITNGNYGVFRDEYYYLACADRLAWGYVDQPPFSIWVLAAWTAIFGDSVHSIRLLPALCGSALIVLTGVAASRLGGGRWAQLLAGSSVGIGAAGLVICGFYSMNCYDLLAWTGAYYLLIRIAGGDGRLWPWLGLVLGLGLFNKIGVLVFGVALVAGLLMTRHRRYFLDLRLYLGGAAAMAFLAPYVLWNAARDWPTREFIDNAKQFKIAATSPLGFLSESILEANPVTVPLWLGGLLWLLLARDARRYRIVGLMVVVTWVLLVLQKSKPYYFAASFPVLMAAGGVAWERWTTGRRWRWGRWAMAVNLLVGLIVFLPLALPALSDFDLLLIAGDDHAAVLQQLVREPLHGDGQRTVAVSAGQHRLRGRQTGQGIEKGDVAFDVLAEVKHRRQPAAVMARRRRRPALPR